MNNTQLEMVRGDQRDVIVPVVTVSGTTTSAADITGKRVIMTAKWEYDDTDAEAVFQKTTGGGGIVVATATNGTATVTIDSTDTSDLPPSVVKLFWDVQVDDNPGAPVTVDRGILTVYPDVTILST